MPENTLSSSDSQPRCPKYIGGQFGTCTFRLFEQYFLKKNEPKKAPRYMGTEMFQDFF